MSQFNYEQKNACSEKVNSEAVETLNRVCGKPSRYSDGSNLWGAPCCTGYTAGLAHHSPPVKRCSRWCKENTLPMAQ
ncbi:jg353, partial [Pararge aegeria aegeria]